MPSLITDYSLKPMMWLRLHVREHFDKPNPIERFAISPLAAADTLDTKSDENESVASQASITGPETISDKAKTKIATNKNTQNELNFHFLFSFINFLFVVVGGNIGLHFYTTDRPIRYWWWLLLNLPQIYLDIERNPNIVMHQIFPPSAWLISDYTIWINGIACALVFLSFTFRAQISAQYRLKPTFDTNKEKQNLIYELNGRRLSSKVSRRIAKFARRSHRLLAAVRLTFWIVCELYCWFYVWHNGKFYDSLASGTYLVSLMTIYAVPCTILYMSYVSMFLIIYVISASRYVQIRQHDLVRRFQRINHKFFENKIQAKTKITNSATRQRLPSASRITSERWSTFVSLNRDAFDICAQIQSYARYWCNYLTIIFPYYILIDCYLIYMVFVATMPFGQKYLFAMIVFDIAIFFFVLIKECADVTRLNYQLSVENRRFFVNAFVGGDRFAAYGKCKQLSCLLKAESMQIAVRFKPYTFKLATGYRINSKTFNLIISYIALFFFYFYKSLKIN